MGKWLSNWKTKSSSGFSLVSVMVAAALVGILATIFATLFQSMIEGQNAARYLSSVTAINDEIRAQLSSKASCLNTFSGLTLTSSATYPITAIKDASNANKYVLNTNYDNSTLKITNMSLVTGTFSGLVGEGTLSITYSAVSKVTGPALRIREIVIDFQRDGSNVITECIAKAKMTDGIWRRQVASINDIFFTDGNVGIGTATPSSILHVLGTTAPTFVRNLTTDGNTSRSALSLVRTYSGGVGAAGIGAQLDFAVETTTESTTTNVASIAAVATDATAGTVDSDIVMYNTVNNVATEQMRINNTGVGIKPTAATTPLAQLHLGGTYVPIQLGDSSTAAVNFHMASQVISGANTFSIYNGNFPTGSLIMRMNSSGQVAIGTTTPEATLHVVKSVWSDSATTSNPTGTWAGKIINRTDSTTDNGLVVGNRNTNSASVSFQAGSVRASSFESYMRVQGDGITHFGNSSQASGALVRFQNVTGTCTMTPAASGTGMACTSDETLKENIVNLNVDTALERILKIESVRYSMIKDPESKRYTGFIAQQLQKVIPEMVREEEDGKLQVYYDGLVPWITAAIKSLYNKISNIRTQVELLIESFKKFQSYTQREVASLRTENLDLKKENEQIKQENTIQFRQIQELRSYLCQRDPAASICK